MDFCRVKVRRSLLILLLLFQTSAARALATDHAAITEKQVMEAIDVMMTKPLSEEMAKAPSLVTEFR